MHPCLHCLPICRSSINALASTPPPPRPPALRPSMMHASRCPHACMNPGIDVAPSPSALCRAVPAEARPAHVVFALPLIPYSSARARAATGSLLKHPLFPGSACLQAPFNCPPPRSPHTMHASLPMCSKLAPFLGLPCRSFLLACHAGTCCGCLAGRRRMPLAAVAERERVHTALWASHAPPPLLSVDAVH